MMFSAQTGSSLLSFHRPTEFPGQTDSSSFNTCRSMLFNQLHDELISEILSRLPAQSLLRLRCVSKSWKALIDSPKLIKSHLSHNGNAKIYLFSGTEIGSFPSDPTGITLNFEGFDLITNSIQSFKVHLSFLSMRFKIPLSFPLCDLSMRVVGSCNGLFCFVSVKLDVIVLVNPSTRAVWPILPPKSRRVGFCEIGFGYDHVRDDYKVVLIQRMGKHPDIEVGVFYFKSKKWKRIIFCSNCNHYLASLCGFYTHGALHWFMPDTNNVLNSSRVDKSFHIATFDLVKEMYTVVNYDTQMFGNPTHVDLVVLGGCLSLCCSRRDRMDVWMMKEYGVKESWFKLVSTGVNIMPLALSKCGRRLLLKEPYCCGLHWYDFDTKSFKDTGIRLTRTSGCLVCLQSLIRLM